MKYNLALEVIHSPENIYKTDKLATMRYVKEVYTTLPSDVNENCWRKCGVLGYLTSDGTSVSLAVSAEKKELNEVNPTLSNV